MTQSQSAELAELVHVFDHELRTPLTALSGHLELVRERAAELPADVVASLEVMSRAVHRLESTVDGVLWLERTVDALPAVG